MESIMERVRSSLRPLIAAAQRRGITPNRLSVINLGLAAAAGLLLALFPGAQLPLLLLTLVLMLRVVLDLLDGMMARELGECSELGVLLNETVEALGATLLYLPLALHPGIAAWLLVLVVTLGLCAEIVGLSALKIGPERRLEGPFGKRDRAILFAVIGLILAFDTQAAAWLPWLLLPAVALTLITIGNRFRAALRASGRNRPLLDEHEHQNR